MSTAKNTRVTIIGIGPVGMILAVMLKKAGCEVALVLNSASRATKMRNEGVKLENVITAEAKFDRVVASLSELTDWQTDFLIFTLKSHHTRAVAAEAAFLDHDNLTVVSAQNGVDVEELVAGAFGENRTLRMVVNFAGNTSAPNCTKVTFFNKPNYLGALSDQRKQQAAHLADLLTSVGLDTHAVDSFEIVKRAWEKTILNSSLSALCGVSRLTMAEAMADRDTVELIEQVIQEGVQVAEAEKIHFSDDFIRQCMKYLRKGGDHFPSLALDLINHRPTEIDYFNGKIVEYGRKHYIRTSLNLSFTNMVKAMTSKHVMSRLPGAAGDASKRILQKGYVDALHPMSTYRNEPCYMGIDLGSAYTKIAVINRDGQSIFRYVLSNNGGERQQLTQVLGAIKSGFNIVTTCATGYGRKHFEDAQLVKTEINCAAAGVTAMIAGQKNIIDIGGEDIKVIRCDDAGQIESFNMNDKCAAGTGAFLAEVAERANIDVHEMSSLAQLSDRETELNSFCTVFAKTEIMNWIFEGAQPADIAKGIYISLVNKIAKMRTEPGIPTVLIGGVIATHPYLRVLLAKRLGGEVIVLDNPQFAVASGAALLAKSSSEKSNALKVETEISHK